MYGVELLTNCFEWRLNYYHPKSGKRQVNQGAVVLSSGTMGGDNGISTFSTSSIPFMVVECPLKGFDTEIGAKLPITFKGQLSCLNNWQIWAFVGYFHLKAHQAPRKKGERIRLEFVRPDVFAGKGLRAARLSIKGEISFGSRRNPVIHDTSFPGALPRAKSKQTRAFVGIMLSVPLANPNKVNAPTTGLHYKLAQRVVRDVD